MRLCLILMIRIKSMTSGYASFDYEIIAEYREGDLVKLGILVNAEPVDASCNDDTQRFCSENSEEKCVKN